VGELSNDERDSAVAASLAPSESGSTLADGARIHWEAWGTGEATAYLVHGAAAHGGWWHGVVPTLAADRRVVAIDLTGHGDSDRRPTYSVSRWSEDLGAVIASTATRDYEIVGHSLGGVVSALACASGMASPRCLVLVDSRSRDQAQPWPPRRGMREYASRDEAMAAFRLLPRQPVVNPEFHHYLAGISVQELDGGGWGWRFDPEVLAPRPTVDLATCVDALDLPVPLIRGELSGLVSPDYVHGLSAGRPNVGPILEVPGAYHHVMIDQPQAFAAILGSALGD
jgi:pimeloyl-ACP methyl ester carboxylesterase